MYIDYNKRNVKLLLLTSTIKIGVVVEKSGKIFIYDQKKKKKKKLMT